MKVFSGLIAYYKLSLIFYGVNEWTPLQNKLLKILPVIWYIFASKLLQLQGAIVYVLTMAITKPQPGLMKFNSQWQMEGCDAYFCAEICSYMH